jgi:hypothetical protein
VPDETPEAPPVIPPTADYYRPDAQMQAQPTAMERIIPSSNPNALVGYYLGLFSIMPVAGLALGPAGIVLGLKGLKACKEHPGLPGRGHAITALIGGILGCLVNYGIGLIILLAFFNQPDRTH